LSGMSSIWCVACAYDQPPCLREGKTRGKRLPLTTHRPTGFAGQAEKRTVPERTTHPFGVIERVSGDGLSAGRGPRVADCLGGFLRR
jgi:hypothetical protein